MSDHTAATWVDKRATGDSMPRRGLRSVGHGRTNGPGARSDGVVMAERGASKGGTAILVATIAASAMAFIDGSIVQIVLPAIQADLGASFATLQWVVTAYALFLGALVLVGGALGDRLGRRRIFMAGTALFVVASALCGLAPTAATLVAARGLQGVGAALMVPQSLAIIAASFPEDRRGAAIGTWAATSALTTAVGPPLGGLLVDLVSWRAAFLVNLPIGLFALILTRHAVPESRAATAAPVDWIAGVLATLGLGALTAGWSKRRRAGSPIPPSSSPSPRRPPRSCCSSCTSGARRRRWCRSASSATAPSRSSTS